MGGSACTMVKVGVTVHPTYGRSPRENLPKQHTEPHQTNFDERGESPRSARSQGGTAKR